MRAERLAGGTTLSEGPVWSPAWDGLRWVDLEAGDVLRLGDDGAVERWHVGTRAAAIRPRRGGGMVVALERGFGLAGDWGSPVQERPEIWTDERIRFNDGACDPDGRFWCGTMRYDCSPGEGALFRLDPDGSVTKAIDGLGLSNGLAWTADGALAYYADTLTGRVDRFDYDAGELHERREFVRVPDDLGAPDGLTIDAEGGVWVAIYGGGVVHRYDPDGSLQAVVEVEDRETTSAAFGGADLDELFITAKGGLYHVTPGVLGLPVLGYDA
jgi:sugar lactone lactonase YvrE